MKPIPDYGDHMPLVEFIKYVKEGYFIDYDGFGYYATEKEISEELILPSHIIGKTKDFNMKTGEFFNVKVKKKINKNYNYVVWFNR